MADIIEFPSLDKRMADEMEPTITHVVQAVIEEARRHLKRHYSRLYREHGEELTQVMASLILGSIAKTAYEQTELAVGSREKYRFLLDEILAR